MGVLCRQLEGILAFRGNATRMDASVCRRQEHERSEAAAGMAHRPHLQRELLPSLRRLEGICTSHDANVRRFSVEVCRPRSVWGAHISELKRDPGLALPIIENVRADQSRYVQLAAGNWLNDASKTRPDWVTLALKMGPRWTAVLPTIVKRGFRTLSKADGFPASGPTLRSDGARISSAANNGAEP